MLDTFSTSFTDQVIELLDFLETGDSQKREQDAIVGLSIRLNSQVNDFTKNLLRSRIVFLPLRDVCQLAELLVHGTLLLALEVGPLVLDDSLDTRSCIRDFPLLHLDDADELAGPPDVIAAFNGFVLLDLNQVHLLE